MRKTIKDVVIVEKNGTKYMATYVVERKVITVSAAKGSKSTQLGGLPPEHLARILLQELISENKA